MNNQLNYFTPSNFTRPNTEVNWAQLAQRWIYSHQMQQQQQAFIPPPPGPFPQQPPPPLIPPAHPPHGHPAGPHMPYHQFERAPQYHQQHFSHPPPPLNHWRQPWMPPPPNLGYPPPRYPLNALTSSSESYPTNLQNQSNDDEEYQAHYDPSLDQDDATECSQRQPQNETDSSNLPEGAMSHWMVDQPWASGVYNSNYMPVIDMQMRKKLPYWILEGLEKAEKEKKKKQEKEELEKRKKEEEEEKRKKREEKGLGKFDSDSEEEEDGSSNGEVKKQNGKNSPVIPEKRQFREFVQEEIEDTRTEEELKEEAIALMRSLITTVLLCVTNREIERIAEEQLTKEKNKAQPKLLAKSSALAALTSLFDDEGDDESSTDGEDSSPTKNICKNLEPIGQPPIEEGLNKAEENSVVFKVPLAPQPRSVTKLELSQDEKLEKLKKFIENKNEESKDERRKEIKKESSSISKEDVVSLPSRHSPNKEKERGKESDRDYRRRGGGERESSSSSGRRDRSKERKRERSRERGDERYISNKNKERGGRKEHERDRNRESTRRRSKSRSPREKRYKSSHHNRSPRR
uniref:Arginine/serine-rich protein PNISR-like n=2 Tax=Meloidogyne TaxID=189290 RepID=A0A914KSN6_MELIC